MKLNKLTPEEEKIIKQRATERPFSGEYDRLFSDGAYLCRQCNNLLYLSKDKFDARCGWPGFDDETKGAVKHELDSDGVRTEILCANCGAHLGHVFVGENLTDKNTRHCVNSLSLRFVQQDFRTGEKYQAVFGGGCFWCLESVFRELRGVESVVSGYADGEEVDPTYERVCAGSTGHAEVVQIIYDSEIISYQNLLEIFFSVHDPTTLNRQGSDIGEQYRSIILYKTWEQKTQVEEFINKLMQEDIYERRIVTEVAPLIIFYPAEEYHQNYYTKNQEAVYCQLVINPKLNKFRGKFKELLK